MSDASAVYDFSTDHKRSADKLVCVPDVAACDKLAYARGADSRNFADNSAGDTVLFGKRFEKRNVPECAFAEFVIVSAYGMYAVKPACEHVAHKLLGRHVFYFVKWA